MLPAMEALIREGREAYAAKQYERALKLFTRAMNLCPCTRGVKRPRCVCKDFEAVATADGSLFNEAMYTCVCDVGKTFNKCDQQLHIKALDYRAGTFEAMKELGRAKKDAEWMLELAPRMPDGYLRLGKNARLQKKPELAWKIYAAGVEANKDKAADSSKKLKQLHDELKPLAARFKRRDPLWLPPELAHMVLSYLDVVELTLVTSSHLTRVFKVNNTCRSHRKCMLVSKSWGQALQSRHFKSLWKRLVFSSRVFRSPSNLALQKLVERAHGGICEIEIKDTERFTLTPQKIETLLRRAAPGLQRLVLGPLLDYQYAFAKDVEFKQLQHLEIVAYNGKDPERRRRFDLHIGDVPIRFLEAVGETLVRLDIVGVPEPWTAGSQMPKFPRLKYLRLERKAEMLRISLPVVSHAIMDRAGSERMLTQVQFFLAAAAPALEQVSFKNVDLGHRLFMQIQDIWDDVWNNLKVFVYVMPPTCPGRRQEAAETIAALKVIFSLNGGKVFQHIDHDIPLRAADQLAPSYELTSPVEWSVYSWNALVGNVTGEEVVFPNLRDFRVANLVHAPDRMSAVLRDAVNNEKLKSFDIVFPLENINAAAGASHVAHLKKYDWLRGLESIRSLGLQGFRFKRYPIKDEDMPLPDFLASFPNLETLSLSSKLYDAEELCSVVEAIMKATHLKTIYQQDVSGACWDKLVLVGKKYGVDIISGPRPEEWPVQLDEVSISITVIRAAATHIVLPNRDNIVLGHSQIARTLDERNRRIAHDLLGDVTDRRPLLYQHAVPEDKLGLAGPGAKGRRVPDGKDGHQAEQVGRPRQDLDDARGAEPVQDHVFEVVYPVAVLLVQLLEVPARGVALLHQVLPRVDELAALDVLDVPLLGHLAEEDLGDGGAQDNRLGVLHLGNLGDVLVGVRVVDLVEGDDGRELLVDEAVDYVLDSGVRPVLEGLLDAGAVEGAVDDGLRRAVARELALQRVDRAGFHGDVPPADGPPALHQIAEDPGHHLAAQPGDVDRRVVASSLLALGVDGARGVNDVDERVGVAQVVEELVA
ncbi:tetratricopeptide-like helical [Purpureocillium lavendulum]|uniref:Tetratricopeptide-like helical n=1 Tax=Purpureocillium lavendulum TaxID=1247861 RepID=A0AB34FN08_9HYPO|nr:tetratricopeptide-like helical [Purpureocillium lavendulum]